MKNYFLAGCIISVVCFYSCEKDITFRLKSTAPKLVVEATIENGLPPLVYLSQSLNFFSKITPGVLEKSFVHNASVFISNGTLTHRLKEYEIPINSSDTFYYYSIDSSSLQTSFTGQLDTEYSLRIDWEGKTYNAVTGIPKTTKKIDSLYWQPAPQIAGADKIALMIKVSDPSGYGDYIRYFTKRNSEAFYPGLASVYDDQVIDGTTYNIRIDRGVDRNASRPEGFMYFNKGDTITLKLCNIDKATFDFWRTMEYSYASTGNPFSSPTHVLSNIEGDALGSFGGYAAQYRTIIVPK